MSQSSWDFHHSGQEIHSEGYYSNLNSALESISLTMGPFRGWPPKLGSDSVYSKHNGAKQNRKGLRIVVRPPTAICGIAHCVCPCAQLQFHLCRGTLTFTTPHMPASHGAVHGSSNNNHSVAVCKLTVKKCYRNTLRKRWYNFWFGDKGNIFKPLFKTDKLALKPWKKTTTDFFFNGENFKWQRSNKIKSPLPLFIAAKTNPPSEQNLPTDWKWLGHLCFFELEDVT